MKKLFKSIGANKTDNAIFRASKASGGVTKIVDAFEEQVMTSHKSSYHTHRSSADDEKLICSDLRDLRPFMKIDGRTFHAFEDISCNPTHSFDKIKFKEWRTTQHNKNILMYYPALDDPEESSESE